MQESEKDKKKEWNDGGHRKTKQTAPRSSMRSNTSDIKIEGN